MPRLQVRITLASTSEQQPPVPHRSTSGVQEEQGAEEEVELQVQLTCLDHLEAPTTKLTALLHLHRHSSGLELLLLEHLELEQEVAPCSVSELEGVSLEQLHHSGGLQQPGGLGSERRG